MFTFTVCQMMRFHYSNSFAHLKSCHPAQLRCLLEHKTFTNCHKLQIRCIAYQSHWVVSNYSSCFWLFALFILLKFFIYIFLSVSFWGCPKYTFDIKKTLLWFNSMTSAFWFQHFYLFAAWKSWLLIHSDLMT